MTDTREASELSATGGYGYQCYWCHRFRLRHEVIVDQYRTRPGTMGFVSFVTPSGLWLRCYECAVGRGGRWEPNHGHNHNTGQQNCESHKNGRQATLGDEEKRVTTTAAATATCRIQVTRKHRNKVQTIDTQEGVPSANLFKDFDADD